MSKKIIKLLIVVIIIAAAYILLTYKTTNYIKKYNKELKAMLGEFTYEYEGYFEDYGYEGLGYHKYKKWKIHFKDAYNNKMTATITNDKDFDSQLLSIAEYVFEKNLITETLDEYIDGEFIDMFNHNKNDKNSVPEITNVYYYTKDKFYNISRTSKLLFSFNWDSNSIYNYNLNTTKSEDLINDNIVFIDYIIYSQHENHEILSEIQKTSELKDLAELTKKINSIVPVNKAYYKLEENNYINQELEF